MHEHDRADIVVSVDEDHLADVGAVAERLQRAGLTVDETLADIGVITGSVDPARTAELEAVEGVAHVERSREFQLPPPDSDVQ